MAGTPLLPIGTTIIATATDSAVTVSNVATGTNVFRILNASTTATTYTTKVGVFKTYAEAAAMNNADGVGVPILPQQSEVIVGNFGISPNPGTVYVAYINPFLTGSSDIRITPLAP